MVEANKTPTNDVGRNACVERCGPGGRFRAKQGERPPAHGALVYANQGEVVSLPTFPSVSLPGVKEVLVPGQPGMVSQPRREMQSAADPTIYKDLATETTPVHSRVHTSIGRLPIKAISSTKGNSWYHPESKFTSRR